MQMKEARLSQPLPTAPDYVLRRQIGFKLSRAARIMQQRLEAALGAYGLTRLSWCVLSGVGLEGLRTPSDIAGNIGVKRPTVSRVLKALAAEGLIRRQSSTQDGRGREVTLTEAGRHRMEMCRPLVAANARHFEGKLSAEQIAALRDLLDRIAEGEDADLDGI